MPSTRLFAVLDCAVDPRLYDHAARLEPQMSRCLFQGRLHPAVKQVSPHLVELTPDDPLTRLWRAEGWGAHWGVWISSGASLHQVWRRLRHFTQATLPSGEGPLLFRFWDPRVLRSFLPLVEPDQIGDWFEDLDAYLVEAPDGVGALQFELRGGALTSSPQPAPK